MQFLTMQSACGDGNIVNNTADSTDTEDITFVEGRALLAREKAQVICARFDSVRRGGLVDAACVLEQDEDGDT